MLMEISVRDIHNDMINLHENGGFECLVEYFTQKFLIIDKKLR